MLFILFAVLLQVASTYDITFCQGSYRPVVLYHGLGSSFNSKGIVRLSNLIQENHPGTFVHVIRIDNNSVNDARLSVFDNANRQLKQVCEDLTKIPELRDGFIGIGLSQGGQLLRGYVERCNNPPVLKLITIGSQHQGINEPPRCNDDSDDYDESDSTDLNDILSIDEFLDEPYGFSLCRTMRAMMDKGVYLPYVRDNVMPAQYFKDHARSPQYEKYNTFLRDINNEAQPRKDSYKQNMIKLESFHMFMFNQEEVVVPKQSSWFYFFNGTALLPPQEMTIYTEDWIGLKTLNESNRMFSHALSGRHMKITDEEFKGNILPLLD